MPKQKLKKDILLIYKRSAYKIYFKERKLNPKALTTKEHDAFRDSHGAHYDTLKIVETILKKYNLGYDKYKRGKDIHFQDYKLVITVGGDGTFLETSRYLTDKHLLFGVNSDPHWSVGQFCSGTAQNFERKLKQILNRKAKTVSIQRLDVYLNNKKQSFQVINDILVAHLNPAAMSRYKLKIGRREEDQRSSGVWISTAAGSTGAMQSAGGRRQRLDSTSFQYKVRELYELPGRTYRLRKGLLKHDQLLEMTSLMRVGYIFVDGSHMRIPFQLGTKMKIKPSSKKLNVVM